MRDKLLKCNVLLIILATLTIVNSIVLNIILESLHRTSFLGLSFYTWIWLHIGLGILCSIIVFYHVFLHIRKTKNWLKWVFELNSKLTKWLVWSFGIAATTGFIAAVCFCFNMEHTPIGGLHGKIGLFAIILMICHLIKRWTWFKGCVNRQFFHPVINNEKCVRCGLCTKKCPAQVFKKQGNQIIVSRMDYCLQCKKCVAHCPKNAIS